MGYPSANLGSRDVFGKFKLQNLPEKDQTMKAYNLIIFLLAIFSLPRVSAIAQTAPTPPKEDANKPVEIAIAVDINKIYDINTINKTYNIDGYITATWLDKRLAFDSDTQEREVILLENDSLSEELRGDIWLPTLEFMNIVGPPEIQNRGLVIRKDGLTVYFARFTGTFTSNMDFRKYPFDTQTFKIQVESFSYNIQDLIFIKPQVFEEISENSALDQWKIIEDKTFISEHQHPFLGRIFSDSQNIHSRYNLEIIAQRKTHYFMWQIFLPLLIIVIASFTVFYDYDLGNQLGIAFTLLLTVVAFNFYVAEHVPKLPYDIFIEAIVTSGYLLIFMEIVAVLIQHRKVRRGQEEQAKNFIVTCRWLFPLSYLVSLIILTIIFFDPEVIYLFAGTRDRLTIIRYPSYEMIESEIQDNA